jgi:hypothetical protein
MLDLLPRTTQTQTNEILSMCQLLCEGGEEELQAVAEIDDAD